MPKPAVPQKNHYLDIISLTNEIVRIQKKMIKIRNQMNDFLENTDETIRIQRRLEKSRISTTVSGYAAERFKEFVKKKHHGVIRGSYQHEMEMAMLFYIHFYDI